MGDDKRARTLRRAFQLCDVGPLGSDEAIANYYVDLSDVRSSVAIRGVSTQLDFFAPGQFDSLLFTGHRGCGKSTELQRLKKSWEKPYRVIYVESDREIDSKDADYTDLYIDHKAVFAGDQLVVELAKASGGHVRQLMQMTATACLTAATRGHRQVQAEDVRYAIQQEQINFQRVIPARHYPLLVEICKTKQIDQNEDGQKMLFNTSVLEYETDEQSWHYINPVVKESAYFVEAVAAAAKDDDQ